MKVYAKNSFDRLGDDLTELILQYLTFEDKVRLECVSKQWRRLIYNKQFYFEILFHSKQTKDSLIKLYPISKTGLTAINRIALESVLNKCQYIQTIRINNKVEKQVLSLIGQYCQQIEFSLKLTYHLKCEPFFRINGHKLEELNIEENSGENIEKIKPIFKFCPNLKVIRYHGLLHCLGEDEEVCPKLEHIKTVCSRMCSSKFKLLSDKYSKTLKTLDIELWYMSSAEVKTCLEHISRLENLRELTLTFGPLIIKEPIDDCLSLIGQKCNKLLKLDLLISSFVKITDKFFDLFSEFKALKKLKINLDYYTVLSGSVECFKHCKQLIDLEIRYRELREDFFANIASFVPKLQTLQILTEKEFYYSFINSFNSMKNIQRITFLKKDQISLYFGKCLSNEMSGPNRHYIIPINDNCGLIRFN